MFFLFKIINIFVAVPFEFLYFEVIYFIFHIFILLLSRKRPVAVTPRVFRRPVTPRVLILELAFHMPRLLKKGFLLFLVFN